MELGPLAALVVIGLLVVVGLVSSARFYRAVLNASGTFARSFEYAIKGVATAIVLGIFVAPVYLFSTLDDGTRALVYQAVGAIIVGYIGLVVLGVIGDRIWKRVASQHEQVTGSRPFASTAEETD